jgi:leucyl/phenylalanyl-tRNA--protein transferase
VPIFRLDDRLLFPRPELAEPDGLLAVGGDLSPRRLLLGYSIGVFPWYSEGQPILWHAPDPRFVLEAKRAHVPRSLEKRVRRGDYEIRWDSAFDAVVQACAETPRPGQSGTWIDDEMAVAYGLLHELGYAHSIEAWREGELVGGLYGVSLGGAFFGESMFARAPDASKVAFVALIARLVEWEIDLVDCQVRTDHLARFGAEDWPRSRFQAALEVALDAPTRRGSWADSALPAH